MTIRSRSAFGLSLLLLTAATAAQSLAGRVVGPGGVPIAGITVDAGRGSTPATTDALGLFLVSGLQNRSYDVEYRPAPGVPWAGRLVVTNVVGATQVGDVALQPGFVVQGTVRNEVGQPLLGCNLNVYDQAGAKLFTPHDGTDALGNFSITVPAGTWDVRAVPPVATLLIPRQIEDVTVAAPMSLGLLTLRTGYPVSGTVVDAVSSVPVGATRIRAYDAFTHEEIVLQTDTANTFGQFSVLLPFGIQDLEFEPPALNTHVGRQMFGVVTLAAMSLGPVRLVNGGLVTGTVLGPGGPVAGADVDVIAADGNKIFTPRDATDATGTFRVAVPNGTGYRLRVEPPRSSGLVGSLGAPFPVAGPTTLGATTLAAGVQVTGLILGPQGPEAGANLNFYDAVTGAEIVTVGDLTGGDGRFTTFVPAGTWNVEVATAEGSFARSTTFPGVVVGGATVFDRTLTGKSVRCAVTSYGTPTLPQGGPLPVNPLLHNLTAGTLPVQIELLLRNPAGVETFVFPPIVIDAIPFPLQLNGIWLTLPTVPAADTGKLLRFVLRLRDPQNGTVLDSASTEFVIQ